jgi:DNA-binding transcriptional MerR regulator
MKTGEVAARVGVSRSTIRNWKDEFAEFLSPHLSKSGKGTILIYNDRDVRVLATIGHCREQRFTDEEIRNVLEDDANLVDMPPLPSKAELAAREKVQLVPVSEYRREIMALTEERDRITAERDEALEQVAALREEVGFLKGRLKREENETGEDQRLIDEIVKLNREIARLELMLEMERKGKVD